MDPRFLRLAAIAVLFIGLACSDRKTPVPGKTCVLKSDCEDPLSCTYGKCHEACRGDGDCNKGEICAFAPLPGTDGGDQKALRVCIDDTCAQTSACTPKLVCGRDLRCRNECEADIDCPNPTYRCVVGGPDNVKVCAEPAVITDAGVLMGDAGTPDASTDDSGVAPDASTPDDGRDAGAQDASMPEDSPVADDGPPSDQGSASDVAPDASTDAADAPADATPDAGRERPLGPCGIPDDEPNDDNATATPYAVGTDVVGCIAMGVDYDYYLVATPPGVNGSKAGGYFRASITNVGSGNVSALVRSGFDNGEIRRYDNIMNELSLFFYWAGRDAESYHVLVSAYSGNSNRAPYKYTLRIDYVALDDPFEPNETAETAAPITVGTPVTAYYFAGYRQFQIPAADYFDWYIIDLAAGATTISVQNVPNKTVLRARLINLSGLVLATNVSANQGAAFTVGPYTVTTPGMYRIQIDANPNADAPSDIVLAIPDSFTKPYTLTVTQQ